MIILAVDVFYEQDQAQIAGVLFNDWKATEPDRVIYSTSKDIQPYVSGAFYQRELPCITQLLRDHRLKPDIVIIDGYVFLDGHHQPGLGKYLFDEFDGKVPVIGVAKHPYRNISEKYALYRGKSKNPLYVTAAGIDSGDAKAYIRQMHGAYRIPTLLKMADQLSRKQTT
ncbi:MAG: endonuclease V [Cyclobacteriaceae bacterium]